MAVLTVQVPHKIVS